MADAVEKDETQLDIEELRSLLGHSTRPKVKALIEDDIHKLITLKTQNQRPTIQNEPIAKTSSLPNKYYKDVVTYAWDQSDEYMKIYVTIDGVHKVPKENITSQFTPKSFLLKVENVNNLNFKCHVAHLWEAIVPSESFVKVKTDIVLLMLKKEKIRKTWGYVVQRDDKSKKSPKFDEKKDPNESLMDLMKKMYEDGDDEMKRTIAKSFAESRNKAQPEEPLCD